jgi:hypothetical protein
MTKHPGTTTRLWSAKVLLMILICPHLAQAITITVKKVKGNSAVIEMSAPLEMGKTYNLESDAMTLTTDYSTQFKSRLNSISLGLNVNIMSGTKVVDNLAAFKGRYGWNHRTFEFGPTVDISIYDKGFGTNTDYLVGLYYDYNVGENKAPRDWVYGPTMQLALGNRNYDTGGSAQVTQAQLGGFMTWFINSSPVALRSEATYLYRRINNTANETTLNGFTAQLYLMYYY